MILASSMTSAPVVVMYPVRSESRMSAANHAVSSQRSTSAGTTRRPCTRATTSRGGNHHAKTRCSGSCHTMPSAAMEVHASHVRRKFEFGCTRRSRRGRRWLCRYHLAVVASGPNSSASRSPSMATTSASDRLGSAGRRAKKARARWRWRALAMRASGTELLALSGGGRRVPASTSDELSASRLGEPDPPPERRPRRGTPPGVPAETGAEPEPRRALALEVPEELRRLRTPVGEAPSTMTSHTAASAGELWLGCAGIASGVGRNGDTPGSSTGGRGAPQT
mmetsp:Transcript_14443/g.34947  ORF Transcript_14443/g.34947 Transcript_14443/m.34947 type:complete len:280 (-) Transcript_14443:2-841(-)